MQLLSLLSPTPADRNLLLGDLRKLCGLEWSDQDLTNSIATLRQRGHVVVAHQRTLALTHDGFHDSYMTALEFVESAAA